MMSMGRCDTFVAAPFPLFGNGFEFGSVRYLDCPAGKMNHSLVLEVPQHPGDDFSGIAQMIANRLMRGF